jgi:hypothetical protein
VAWFRDVLARLGAERWTVVEAAAKYGSSGSGHTRAQLFARAMLGAVTRAELEARIAESRHQDSIRALGLLPLADGDEGRRDVLERYGLLQEIRREGRKLGAARQQKEGGAVQVALANLARTAGYRDPQRLQWAMEREAVADLVDGALERESAGTVLRLGIGDDGAPYLEAEKDGKPLATVPAALRKDPVHAELRDRLAELRKQAARVRTGMEEAMCRGDLFTGGELRDLLAHPMLAPALTRLVFVGEDQAGYPAEGGRALRDAAGVLHPVGGGEALRLAHPDDLFHRGDWSAWQRECFRAERVQPFKQLFREFYPLTDGERGGNETLRYAGHQVRPGQALALLRARGWAFDAEEGVHRTFHESGLTARLTFQESFHTPAEVEGLTLEGVVFTPRGRWARVPLASVPPRVLSEALRDLDLVVSVAHLGGADPEATASTVEMRAALLRETCELLGLRNVEVGAKHATVRGELGTYAVHLGSAGVSMLPGAALLIVAVHSQHRGRLFLPFADDDPKTAEVLSKVLLLARDRQIKDPAIIAQIRASARPASPL